jgi:hypothetical protein
MENDGTKVTLDIRFKTISMNKGLTKQLYPLDNSNFRNYLILFLLWPFLAFLMALKNYNQKESKKIVYLFLIYYGLTFVIGNIGVDSERYALSLMQNAELPFSALFDIVGGLYKDTTVDIAEPLISFFVSRFTSYHGVLFAVFAAIFGFFYLKSINLLYDRYKENRGLNTFILLVFFVMIVPITLINGFRMYTATWIFFFASWHVIVNRDPKYLLLAGAASLIHWSFLSANAILIIYYLAGNRNFIYLPVVLLSFLMPNLLAPFFQLLSLKLGGPIQNRYEGYSSEGYILGIQKSYENAAWFMGLIDNLIFYYLIGIIIFIQLRYGHLLKEKIERNFFSFLLLFLAFVNFGMTIPTFGGRFQRVFYLYATVYVFLYFLKNPGKKISFLIQIGLFPMALYSAYTFRLGSESISAWILTPGFGLPLLAPTVSLAEILFY